MSAEGTSSDADLVRAQSAEHAAGSKQPTASGGSMLRATTVSESALIRVLMLSQRRQLDAASLVAQLSLDFPGVTGQRMAEIAALLSNGYSVVDSLQLVRGIVNPSLVMALRLSHDAGNLPQVYEMLLAESDGDDLQTSDCLGRLGSDLIRVVLTIVFACLVASFVATWILPTFVQMFEEFQLALPPLMELTISLSTFVPLLLMLAMGVVVLLLVWQAPVVGVSLRSRLKPSAAGGRFVTPSANLLSLLSLAAQSGRPLSPAFGTLARYHPDAGTRNRLRAAVERIDKGEEPWSSLAAEGLLSAREAASLSLASSGRTQAMLLHWRATLRQSRYSLKAHLVVRTFSILATLALAIFVGMLALSVFLVLSSLISGLA